MIYRTILKRLLDITVAAVLLVLLSPILLTVAVLLALRQNGAVLFRQRRPGYRAKPIYILKFKSMTDARDAEGQLLPDRERLTAIGRWIRSTSIDELPQLINVLKGDMSLVGPRPLLFKYLPLYSKAQLRRHEVKPGITGWAQVNGRNAISWSKKFELDVDYVDRVSFLMDVKILLLTVNKVLVREGINQSEARTMESFNGEN